jgi:glycine hydroxymethyltransferase
MTDAVRSAGFFTAHLAEADPEVHAAELKRQRTEIELIASENIVSRPCWRRRARS